MSEKRPKFPGPGGEKVGKRIGRPSPDDDLSLFDEILEVADGSGAPDMARYAKDARRLLGLDVEWELLSDEEKQSLLRTPERIAAFECIDTTTNPRGPKIREKKGIVSEIVRRDLLSKELLRTSSTVYLGSGDDIEYPLALGARKIELVDPIFGIPESVVDLERRLETILKQEVRFNETGEVEIPFDFGDGSERVSIKIVPAMYPQEGVSSRTPDVQYHLPEKVGLVILFASQGSGGVIQPSRDIEGHITQGGAILSDRVLMKYPEGSAGQKEIIGLGKKEE